MTTDHDIEEPQSKSQVKRDMHALTDLGARLVELTIDQLDKIPLEDKLRDAILECKDTTKHGARKRQLKYIGKLMRSADGEAIRSSLEAMEAPQREAIAEFHAVERWRDRLIAEGDAALAELLGKYPAADRQQLRQLVRNAGKKQSEEKAKRVSRELFRTLRDLIKDA